LSARAAVAQATRSLYATAIVRWVFGVMFLFAAFEAFPEHKWPIGFGLLVFNLSVSGVICVLQAQQAVSNLLLDRGERKTRWTVVLAAELAGEPHDEFSFWSAVDRRVNDELKMDEEAEPGFWRSAGLVAAGVLWRLLADLFGIGLVASLTA
jgi:hypothetical protein